MKKGDVLVLQKIKNGWNRFSLNKLAKIRAGGVSVVFVECDFLVNNSVFSQTDRIVVASGLMRNLLIEREGILPEKIYSIIDTPETIVEDVKPVGKKIALVWYGAMSQDRQDDIDALRSMFEADSVLNENINYWLFQITVTVI